MRRIIAVDMDGFLTKIGVKGNIRFPNLAYSTVLKILSPKPRIKNIERVRRWKNIGFEIVIVSARPERVRDITEKWLKKHNLEVDEIILVGPGNVKEKKLNALEKIKPEAYHDDDSSTVNYLKKRGICAVHG